MQLVQCKSTVSPSSFPPPRTVHIPIPSRDSDPGAWEEERLEYSLSTQRVIYLLVLILVFWEGREKSRVTTSRGNGIW